MKFKEQPLSLPGPRPRSELPSFVYVLATIGAAGNCSPVKIGLATNPERRLASIQTACPSPIRIETYFGPMHREIARYIEQQAHRLYAKHKLHGEWFDVPPLEAAGLVEDLIREILSGDRADEILGEEPREYP